MGAGNIFIDYPLIHTLASYQSIVYLKTHPLKLTYPAGCSGLLILNYQSLYKQNDEEFYTLVFTVISFSLIPDLPTTVCVVVAEVFEAELNPLTKIAGELLQIDATALVVSGFSATAVWLLPIVVSALGIGAVIIRKKF